MGRLDARERSHGTVRLYHRDGTFDKTFGGDGKVVTDASGSGVRSGANAVAIDSLGRILAAGSVNGNPERTAVVRYVN